MQPSLPFPDVADEGLPSSPPRRERIFINRSLRMDQVEAVGFDMDYTLAIYGQEAMDRQSIAATIPKLVARGYPASIADTEFRDGFAVRGLLVDRKLGNVLKMDRYRYVKRAYHGYRELTVDERREHYHKKRIAAAGGRYVFVDTLYALCEVAMYAGLIDSLERDGHVVDYERLWNDIRASVDASHQDGSILDHVLADLPRFIRKDPGLAPMLHKLRSSGKRLFLLTNSQPAYTDTLMRHLLEGELSAYPSWRRYFDAVVTAARKPGFFDGTAPFHEVLEGGRLVPATALERGRTYAGGNLADLERMLGLVGDRVLYVGDHIYGDVLRAKKEGAWRTVMIIQEMEDELAIVERLADDNAKLDQLERQRERIVDEMRVRQHALKKVQRRIDEDPERRAPERAELDAERLTLRRTLEKLRQRLDAVEDAYAELEVRLEGAFHPIWGSIFRTGTELSGFGDQVEEFACLYTSRASNLRHYSAAHYFQSSRERMPHEL